MKRIFYLATLIGVALFASCEYDDSAVWDELNDLSNRITQLEERVNSNIQSIQQLAAAVQNNDYIKSITPISENGTVIGYTITFLKSNPITIYHGKDGSNGVNGENGSTPIIGVKKDSDDVYYWTLNGDWLLDEEGNKVRATGKDGTNGTNGANGANGINGQDGITPKLKIEQGKWFISYDDGKSWAEIGQATGDEGPQGPQGPSGENGTNGTNGDSFFKSVEQDENYVIFTLADDTQIKVLKASAISQIKLSHIPRYAIGKASVYSPSENVREVVMDFQVMPKSAATIIAEGWQKTLELKAVESTTRSVDYIDLPINDCEADLTNGVITIKASGKNLPDRFFVGDAIISAALLYNTDLVSTMSEFVELDAISFSLTIPFKSNAFVTPLDSTSRVTPSCANSIINRDLAEMITDGWKHSFVESEPHQISIFFHTALVGEIDLGFVASSAVGEAALDVKINGKSYRVNTTTSNEAKFYYAGRYNIDKPGYVRVDIIPVSTTSGSYPNISALRVGGKGIGYATSKGDNVCFVTPEESAAETPYFIRRGPSVHFRWDYPKDTEYFYNEVYVAEGNDVKGAYYVLIGGKTFYIGIQPNTKGKDREVLFSVWDTDIAAGYVAELVSTGDKVVSNRFGHEGSGVQNRFYYDWEAGRTYAILIRVRPEVIDGKPTGHSLYTGYFRGDEGWIFLAEIRRQNLTTYLDSPFSFSENFLPEQGWIPRRISFPSQWMRDKDGVWHEVLSGRITCDKTGYKNIRRDQTGGVDEQGHFYLSNIGYINESTPYNFGISRRPTGATPPDIDLEALEKLATNR